MGSILNRASQRWLYSRRSIANVAKISMIFMENAVN